ncbi:DUF418 domain-containing protein [Dysgonomonas sp. HDW5B]|uniref:DUF418 domain-containing protein n=1 Tax=Dysgonomonas sp. HDW5B TaxID=2714927 RepID=UPI001409EB5A|nr:DUF418 domain-containing protein [Dysgonomonas sp. HDW5B]QIK54433.1 DUF418 domain-containing protein [Dysgonomonas sp. HDW5B]
MEQTQTIIPKKRINSIDALRGFALLGILLFHCMEHFDLAYTPTFSSPFWQSVDNIVLGTITFLFAGKSYAIFSLLFGLSFFMQMDSQADKGVDFRFRFLWRLTILLVLGYLNGLIYMGEFFFVYAVVGVFIIPLYKVPTKWLVVLLILLLLQIPDIINFVSLLSGNAPNEPTSLVKYMDDLYDEAVDVFANGSFSDVLAFNVWKGLAAKMLWVLVYARYPQLLGLFIAGMLIGRLGIHKSEEKMIKYSSKVLPYAIVGFVIFYSIILFLPHYVDGFTLNVGTTLFKAYANLNMMMMYICILTLLYYKTKTRSILDLIAPVGRMSVTNYMVQSFVGVILFYGFGANLATKLSFLQCFLLGMAIYIIQVGYSNWWMKKYYYGPVEWLWRTITWFKGVPFLRK